MDPTPSFSVRQTYGSVRLPHREREKSTNNALLASMLLADGRFPAGGHVHSVGIEAAIGDGRVVDEASLEAFVVGRLQTVGLTEATLAAATLKRLAACHPTLHVVLFERLDAEAESRIVVPSLRDASRKQGRQLCRVGGRCWPSPLFVELAEVAPDGAHFPVAFGVTAAAAGLDVPDVAALIVHHAVTTPAQAAVRLLGLDPFAVAALTVRVGEVASDVMARAVDLAVAPLAELPAESAPILDIAAALHAASPSRLFAT
jgi:urease accessory protein